MIHLDESFTEARERSVKGKEMLKMKTKTEIREAILLEGKSIRQVSKDTGHSRNTIRKMIEDGDALSYKKRVARPSEVLGPYKGLLESWVKEDEKKPRKARRTGVRIYKLLCDEHGYRGAESTIRAYVGKLRGKVRKQVYIPLSYEPGETGQVDFGEAELQVDGARVKAQLFVMWLGYSGAMLMQCRCSPAHYGLVLPTAPQRPTARIALAAGYHIQRLKSFATSGMLRRHRQPMKIGYRLVPFRHFGHDHEPLLVDFTLQLWFGSEQVYMNIRKTTYSDICHLDAQFDVLKPLTGDGLGRISEVSKRQIDHNDGNLRSKPIQKTPSKIRMVMAVMAAPSAKAQLVAQALGITTTNLYDYINGDGTPKKAAQLILSSYPCTKVRRGG